VRVYYDADSPARQFGPMRLLAQYSGSNGSWNEGNKRRWRRRAEGTAQLDRTFSSRLLIWTPSLRGSAGSVKQARPA
jgi:hypothetical protein